MLNEQARGVYTISATPFSPDGRLDIPSLERLTDFYLAQGATGLTILGIMGEANMLSPEEAEEVIACVVSRARVPVITGVSSPDFTAMGALARRAVALGAAGAMVAPAKGTTDTVAYYARVAETLDDIPFVIQDFPLVTGVQMPIEAILTVVADHPTCVMLKHEDWPGLEKISALRAASDAGARRISILCGNGGQFLPEEMARGADGAMTGFAYPQMMAGVVAAHDAGERHRAQDIFDAYLPLIRLETQPGLGLAVRKYILARNGAIAHATLRAPFPGLTPAMIAEIEFLIARQEARLALLG